MSFAENHSDHSTRWRHDLPPTPPFILLEVTNACNLRCRMCFIYGEGVTTKRSSGFMSENIWRKAIEEIGSWDSRTTVDLHGAGEPLLHPQLFDIIAHAKTKKNISVGFLTNATLMDEAKARAVVGAGTDWIGFSVDGSQKEVFEYYRKGAVLEEVEGNIEGLLSLRKNGKPNVYLNMVCHAEADTNLFLDKWKGKVDTILLSSKRNNDKKKNKAVVLKSPCPLLYEQLIMGWDGKSVLCCEDYYGDIITGNFPDKSLSEIWHGSALSLARRLHEKGDYREIDLCASCDSVTFHECAEEEFGVGAAATVVRKELSTVKPEFAAEGNPCPLCSSQETVLLLKRKDDLPVYRCNSCSFMFTPRSIFEGRYGNIEDIYEQDYFRSTGNIGYSDYASISAANFLWQPAFLELVEGIKGKRILDVGCATGVLLGMLQERGASEIAGVEISAFAAAEAASKGFQVFSGDLMSLDVGRTYDIITAFDVIEHVPDIHAFLSRIYELLGDNGVFVFLTPDAGSEEALSAKENWYGFGSSLEHIHYFSAASLRFALSKTFQSFPVLYPAATADGQGILGFVRKQTSQRDAFLQRLFDRNFATELIDETTAVPVSILLHRMGDPRYKEIFSRFRHCFSALRANEDVRHLLASLDLSGSPEKQPTTAIVREYREGDEASIVKLFGEVFERQMSLEEWRWKYTSLEHGKVRSVVLEDTRAGIVGHYGGILLRMVRGDQEIKGASSCDVMIHPKYRSFARLKRLHNFYVDCSIRDSIFMLYGFPTEETLMVPADKLGLYERIEAVHEGIKDVKFNNDTERFFFKLFPMNFDDPRIDELWDKAKEQYGLGVIRDRAYLKWRFQGNPLFSYSIWGLRKRWSEELLALAVVRNEQSETMRIMDVIFRRNFLPTLLRKVENMACVSGKKQLRLWAPGMIRNVLKDAGFSVTRTGTTLPRSTHPLTVKKDEILTGFFYSMADTDYL